MRQWPRKAALLLVLLIAAAGAFAAREPGAGAETVRLELDRSANQLSVYRGEEQIRQYAVSVGKRGYETPLGSYRISHVVWNPWWHPPASKWARNKKVTPPGRNNPMGRAKLFFAPELYIHGTQKVERLGEPASHGCVRMANGDVIELARLVHEYGAPKSSSTIDRLVANRKMTRQVWLKRKVPFRIRA